MPRSASRCAMAGPSAPPPRARCARCPWRRTSRTVRGSSGGWRGSAAAGRRRCCCATTRWTTVTTGALTRSRTQTPLAVSRATWRRSPKRRAPHAGRRLARASPSAPRRRRHIGRRCFWPSARRAAPRISSRTWTWASRAWRPTFDRRPGAWPQASATATPEASMPEASHTSTLGPPPRVLRSGGLVPSTLAGLAADPWSARARARACMLSPMAFCFQLGSL
mmetsp:Transcript_1828/g.5248  ORF Transcript_1828/g.5248 Transcript_1828/m.5248 type:complete len:222 (-) Transcript_1828:36-701(-)